MEIVYIKYNVGMRFIIQSTKLIFTFLIKLKLSKDIEKKLYK